MARLSPAQREALDLLRDAEAQDIAVIASYATVRKGIAANRDAWCVATGVAKALLARELVTCEEGIVTLTEAGRTA